MLVVSAGVPAPSFQLSCARSPYYRLHVVLIPENHRARKVFSEICETWTESLNSKVVLRPQLLEFVATFSSGAAAPPKYKL